MMASNCPSEVESFAILRMCVLLGCKNYPSAAYQVRAAATAQTY